MQCLGIHRQGWQRPTPGVARILSACASAVMLRTPPSPLHRPGPPTATGGAGRRQPWGSAEIEHAQGAQKKHDTRISREQRTASLSSQWTLLLLLCAAWLSVQWQDERARPAVGEPVRPGACMCACAHAAAREARLLAGVGPAAEEERELSLRRALLLRTAAHGQRERGGCSSRAAAGGNRRRAFE